MFRILQCWTFWKYRRAVRGLADEQLHREWSAAAMHLQAYLRRVAKPDGDTARQWLRALEQEIARRARHRCCFLPGCENRCNQLQNGYSRSYGADL